MKELIRKAAIGTVALLATATGIGAAAPAANATVSAAPFNLAYCNPNNHTVQHQMEVYRTGGETVTMRSAIVDSNGVHYGPWSAPSAGTTPLFGVQNWNNVRGATAVYTQWGVWNWSTRQYTYSTLRLTGAALNTYGYPIGTGIYAGGSTGVCNA